MYLVDSAKCVETCVSESWQVQVLLLIEWQWSIIFFSQLLNAAMQKPHYEQMPNTFDSQ